MKCYGCGKEISAGASYIHHKRRYCVDCFNRVEMEWHRYMQKMKALKR